MTSLSGLLERLPGRRAARRQAEAHRTALAQLDFALAELVLELKRLSALSQTSARDDATAAAKETAATAQVLELLAHGESLASRLSDREIAAAWQRLAASIDKARLLGHGPHRATGLMAAASECERLQQLVDQRLVVS